MKYLLVMLVFSFCRGVTAAQEPNKGSNYSVPVPSSGNSNDLAQLLNDAISAGFEDIFIPTSKNWVWNSTVTIPALRRINIWGSMSKSYDYAIKIRCGNKNPAIDAQGSLFSTIKGLNFYGDGNDPSKEPACFILYARMPDKSSSSNHLLADNIIDGSFYYCCIYNIGSEESSYINNYVSFSGSHNPSINEKNAVYIYSENDIFSDIKSKRPRPKGSSMSAVTNQNETIKSFVKGSSNFYFGVHAQDITLNINYAVTPENSNFVTIESIAGNIHISPNRVELAKSSHIIKINGNNDVGAINFEKGSFIRSDITNTQKEVFAIDIEGTPASYVTLNISPNCNFTTTAYKPDIKLIRISRMLQSSDINFISTAEAAEVTVNQVMDSRFLMKTGSKFSGNLIRSQVIFPSSISSQPSATSSIPKEAIISGSVALPAGKINVVIRGKGGKINRGIATSTGDQYCYFKFSENDFTIYVNKADKLQQSISYQVWNE